MNVFVAFYESLLGFVPTYFMKRWLRYYRPRTGNETIVPGHFQNHTLHDMANVLSNVGSLRTKQSRKNQNEGTKKNDLKNKTKNGRSSRLQLSSIKDSLNLSGAEQVRTNSVSTNSVDKEMDTYTDAMATKVAIATSPSLASHATKQRQSITREKNESEDVGDKFPDEAPSMESMFSKSHVVGPDANLNKMKYLNQANEILDTRRSTMDKQDIAQKIYQSIIVRLAKKIAKLQDIHPTRIRKTRITYNFSSGSNVTTNQSVNRDREDGKTDNDDKDVDVEIETIKDISTKVLYLILANPKIISKEIHEMKKKMLSKEQLMFNADLIEFGVIEEIRARILYQNYEYPRYCKPLTLTLITLWGIVCAIVTTSWCLWFQTENTWNNGYENQRFNNANFTNCSQLLPLKTILNYNATQDAINSNHGHDDYSHGYNPPRYDSFGEDFDVSSRFLMAVFLSYLISVFFWNPLLLAFKVMYKLYLMRKNPDYVGEGKLFYNEKNRLALVDKQIINTINENKAQIEINDDINNNVNDKSIELDLCDEKTHLPTAGASSQSFVAIDHDDSDSNSNQHEDNDRVDLGDLI